MTMLTVILLVGIPSAQAALEALEQAYDMTADKVERWPLGDHASIVFRPCASCERLAISVSPATLYARSLSGAFISRAELLELKSVLSNTDDTFVYVFYRPDDGIATRIVLDVGE